MKNIFATLFISLAFITLAKADDKPATYDQLPAAAKTFIAENYSADQISYITVDDDIILPDYTVMLQGGVKIEFENNGSLSKISSSQNGIPAEIIPMQIRDYVRRNYPDAAYVSYEIDRNSYEVTLSNRLELKFNSRFALVEIDD